jgi:hypothetical protein
VRSEFIDTLKIIAYRAETAMAQIVREQMGEHHQDEARAFVRDLYPTEANLIPDIEAKTLTVELHSLATPFYLGLIDRKICIHRPSFPDLVGTLNVRSPMFDPLLKFGLTSSLFFPVQATREAAELST